MTPRDRTAAEVYINGHLVRRLLAAQFPHWAGLPLELVGSTGWDNTIYRLGADLAVRLPRRDVGTGHIEREHQWLPMLAPQLPLPVPSPLGKGAPAEGYPWHWTVCPWLPGETAAVQPIADQEQAAIALAQFVTALQAIDPAGGPGSEFRGVPLAGCDRAVRAVFRDALSADDAAWARGRGWALDFGLMCAAHAAGNPVLGHIGQHTVREVLADHGYAITAHGW
jgi:aminoglycoside phosphotransferase (APT) family kinase protein